MRRSGATAYDCPIDSSRARRSPRRRARSTGAPWRRPPTSRNRRPQADPRLGAPPPARGARHHRPLPLQPRPGRGGAVRLQGGGEGGRGGRVGRPGRSCGAPAPGRSRQGLAADVAETSPERLARPVSIPVGDVTLDADLTLPPGAEAVVVFAHGTGSGRHSPRNRLVASVLSEAGLGTLLMD